MKIVCVQCGIDVVSSIPSLTDQTVVMCSGCGTGLRVTIQTVALAVAESPEPVDSSPGKVLVAVCGEATRECIRETLGGGQFEVVEVETAQEAIQRIQECSPNVAIIDVGLPDMLGYHACEAIRREPQGEKIKVLLVAAMYNEDRFKRQPASLYGADGFLERHQIEDELLPKLRAICETAAPVREPESSSVPQPDPSPIEPISEEAIASSAPPVEAPLSGENPIAPGAPQPEPVLIEPNPVRRAEAAPPSVVPSPAAPQVQPSVSDPGRHQSSPSADSRSESALRLARIIVSDIALYNTKKVDEGVLQGTFFDLLRSEIEEGRRLYQERCSPDLAGGTDYFQLTLEQFVETRKRLLQRRDSAAA